MDKTNGWNNLNGISDDDKTCAITDMNCLGDEDDTSCGLTDMNCVDGQDMNCALDNMNCDEDKKDR